jgi:hypothetical protein
MMLDSLGRVMLTLCSIARRVNGGGMLRRDLGDPCLTLGAHLENFLVCSSHHLGCIVLCPSGFEAFQADLLMKKGNLLFKASALMLRFTACHLEIAQPLMEVPVISFELREIAAFERC